MKYEKLFEKGKIGKLTLKNRIVMTPMGTGFAAASGEASEEIIKFYEERAKGGVGLIICEVCRVDELSGIAQPCQLRATDMNVIPSFTRMVDRIHAYDTKVFMQLHHPGNEAFPITLHGNPVIGPSPVMCKTVGVVPKEMATAEVEAMVKNYVKAAVIAKTAGFDGVEIHAAHGYLVNQFMSPHTNHRTDKYGGDFFNRMRFISEIIISIRFACGADFPIKNGDGRTVAVIGAGPSGLQAAITLAKRGFKVVVFEKSDRIGGNMNLAAVPPCKGLMPESVKMWTEARDVSAMQEALSDIIGAYERDFAKHPNLTEFPKISMIWKSVPSQLARENKKFIYKVVKEGARAREYEDALQWLVDARLVHKVYSVNLCGISVEN